MRGEKCAGSFSETVEATNRISCETRLTKTTLRFEVYLRSSPANVRQRGKRVINIMSQAPPVASVIIPCYKQAHFLGEAIESVLAQTY